MYKLKVNDKYNFEYSAQDIEALDSIKIKDGTFHVIKDHKSVITKLISSSFLDKTYSAEIGGNIYNIVLKDPLDQQITSMGFEVGSLKQINKIIAPMPGLILEIEVNIGQEVKENDTLLILEAMKMENSLTSPRDGIIKSILVAKGETVNKNDILIEFE